MATTMRSGDPTQGLRAVRVSSSAKALTDALRASSPEAVAPATRRLVELEGDRVVAAQRARLFDVDLSLVADVAKALTRI